MKPKTDIAFFKWNILIIEYLKVAWDNIYKNVDLSNHIGVSTSKVILYVMNAHENRVERDCTVGLVNTTQTTRTVTKQKLAYAFPRSRVRERPQE